MTIPGLRSTADFEEFKERPENWRETLIIIDTKGQAPLTALTSLMKTKKTDDPLFWMFQEEAPVYRILLDEDLDTTETEITVVSGAKQLKLGDILRVEHTGELLLVTTNPTADTSIPVVSRDFRGLTPGTGAAVTLTAAGTNPYLMLVGPAYEEGSTAPPGRTYNVAPIFNYTQIFRDTLEITRTAQKTKYRTGDALKNDKRRCLRRFSLGMEKSFIFGKKGIDNDLGTPRTTTGGIVSWLDSDHVIPVGGTLDADRWGEVMLTAFTQGNDEKFGLCGNRALSALNEMARKNTLQIIDDSTTEYGMRVHRFLSPFGQLTVKTHPFFNQIPSGVTAGANYYGLDSWLLLLDMEYLKYRPLLDSDVQWQDRMQVPGTDGLHAGFIAEAGIEVTNSKAHTLITEMFYGAKDS